jgi:release factor glutamine methyltransferase
VTITIGDVLERTAGHLAAKGCETPRLDAELLLGKALGMERIELYMHLDRPLSAAELERARGLVARRAGREPLQYVLGEWGFRRLTLAVDRRALIPRPETEVVVERCLALLHGIAAPRVLDVGTGSGAIALAVADEHPGAVVTAIDVSDAALALARENAARTGLQIELLSHDLRKGLPGEGWDLVVSNPPYVAPAEHEALAPEVREWEPESALVGEGATEAVARAAADVLRPGGALVLEVAAGRAPDVAALLAELGFEQVAVVPDLSGRDRVVEGRRR